MESRSKLVDTFQIVGFAISTTVAILLVVAQVDPMQSTLMGLMLAVFTQLFDLQLRYSKSEERILQANTLSQSLYHDTELLNKVRQIVDDYYSIMDGWFDLYKTRAEHAMSDCHRVLRSMSGGVRSPELVYPIPDRGRRTRSGYENGSHTLAGQPQKCRHTNVTPSRARGFVLVSDYLYDIIAATKSSACS